MSTLKTTNIAHPSATGTNIVLNSDDSATFSQIAGGAISSGAAVASTSGTAIDFTGIPSWVKRVTVMLSGVSWDNTVSPLIQLGDSGGVETTGYTQAGGYTSGIPSASIFTETSGFGLASGWSVSTAFNASIIFSLLDSATNTWVAQGICFVDSGNDYALFFTGTKSLSGILDRVRVTSSAAVTFDAGIINILYEG